MQHIIKKQVIDLRIEERLDAFRIQQAVSNHYRQHLMPLLEKEFDRIAGPDEVISIDRMEIDLGEITEAEISKLALNDYIANEVVRQVAENVKNDSPAKANISVRKAAAVNSSMQWLFYMQKGYLPWSLLKTGEQWHSQVLEALATDYGSIQEVRKAILENSNVARRIAAQYSAPFLVKLTEILTAENQAVLPEAIDEIIKAALIINPSKKLSAEQLWGELLLIAAHGNDKAPLQISEALLKNNLPVSEAVTPKEIKKIKQQVKIILPVIKKIEEGGIVSKMSTDKREDDLTVKKANPDEEHHPQENNALEKGESPLNPLPAKDAAGSSVQEIGSEGIFVTNAGIVLAHPFLSMLFSRLGLISEKKFTGGAACEKAVFALHYIATGTNAAEEHELLMPKILCGYRIGEPIAKEMHFTPEETEAMDGLIEAVIQQWSILKNTSPEGLRETFLKRAGKISAINESIHIQVEQGPVDMLLDHLPWNLGMIKLPWLNELIRVEWR